MRAAAMLGTFIREPTFPRRYCTVRYRHWRFGRAATPDLSRGNIATVAQGHKLHGKDFGDGEQQKGGRQMQEPGLCEIALGGFQTFDELTRIPIGRLTFLFGPNSAGKSSVEDGIRLLSEICDTGDHWEFNDAPAASFDTSLANRKSRLKRKWRRTGEGPDSYAELMQLGASALIDGVEGWYGLLEDLGVAENPEYYNAPSPGLHRLEVNIQFRDRVLFGDSVRGGKWSSRTGLNGIWREITLSLDGLPFLELFDEAEAALNFGHPLLSARPMPEACKVAERLDPVRVSTTGSWLRIRGGMWLDDQKHLDQWSFVMSWIHGDWIGGTDTPSPEMTAAFRSFAEIFDIILVNACRMMGAALKPYTVPASRTTPTHEELSFFGDRGDPRYRRLAQSFEGSKRQDLEGKDSDEDKQPESLHRRVNRMLTGHLFRERGYQLHADYRILMTPEQFEGRHTPDDEAKNDAGRGFLLEVAIRLADAQGRRYAFTEVGSGLGYVLPVLAATCDESRPVVVVQQPELHLHPALQAELGDVFVELSSGGRRLIIETHSEHLLLRVLKRLRQSGNATGSNPELHVEPDDVAILYFDPHPDGTTKVKRLRVSADGEFLDRWPRGFFTERDEELFDE